MQEAAPEGQGDVAVPFAVCCLLLGDSPAAESILGFGPSPAGMPVDPSIQAFIKVSLALLSIQYHAIPVQLHSKICVHHPEGWRLRFWYHEPAASSFCNA